MQSAALPEHDLAWTPIGNWPAREAVAALSAAGAVRKADRLAELIAANDNPLSGTSKVAAFGPIWGGDKGMFAGTGHTYGFVPAGSFASSEPLEVRDAGNMEPDVGLSKQRIKVTLDRLVALDYPGEGRHNVLVEFTGSHQMQGGAHEVRFAQTYAVDEDDSAGVAGYPVFLGLAVGNEGLKFRITTRNVANDDDRKLLGMLDGEAFAGGLKLLMTAQPALEPMAAFAKAIGQAFARRHENILVQEVNVGLDFEPAVGHLRLAQGTYFAVQVGGDEISWSEWEYVPDRRGILRKGRHDVRLPYNHLAFSVSAYHED